VFFRADNFSSAITMLQGMVGMNGISIHKAFAKYAAVLATYLHITMIWMDFRHR